MTFCNPLITIYNNTIFAIYLSLLFCYYKLARENSISGFRGDFVKRFIIMLLIISMLFVPACSKEAGNSEKIGTRDALANSGDTIGDSDIVPEEYLALI